MPDDDLKSCPTCGGTGSYNNQQGNKVECYACVGTGWVKK
jgi:DnaJ-class molecular chaperone